MQKKILYLFIFLLVLTYNPKNFALKGTMPKSRTTLEKKIEIRDKMIKSLHNIINKQTNQYKQARREIENLKKIWNEKNWPAKLKKSLQITKKEKNKLRNEKIEFSNDVKNFTKQLDEINQAIPLQVDKIKKQIKKNERIIADNKLAEIREGKFAKAAKKKIKEIETAIKIEHNKKVKNYTKIGELNREFKKRMDEHTIFEGRLNGASSKINQFREVNTSLQKSISILLELQTKIKNTKKISEKYKKKGFFAKIFKKYKK